MGARRTQRDRIDAVLEAPATDYIGATVIVGGVLALAQPWQGFDVLGHLDDAARADLYGRLIGPLSIVASIATAGLAVYAGNSGPTMTLLRAVYGRRILKQFRGAAAAAGIGVLALVAVYVAQVGYGADWTRWIAMGAAVFIVLRTLRVIYFYSHVLTIVDEDKVPPQPRPSLDDLPTRPTASRR
jgi:hypothetical protein